MTWHGSVYEETQERYQLDRSSVIYELLVAVRPEPEVSVKGSNFEEDWIRHARCSKLA